MATGRWKLTNVDGVNADWLPIVDLSSSAALGVSRAGEWLVGTDEDCLPVTSPRAGVRLLALLERGQLRVRTQLHGWFATVEARPDIEVPIEAAIRAGLDSGSKHWAALALDWISASSSASSFAEPLRQVSAAAWATQQIRHRAQRLLRQA